MFWRFYNIEISFPLLLRRQQPGIFARTRQTLLLRCRLWIEVRGRTFEHCSKLVRNTSFFRILQWICLISILNQTQLDGPQRYEDASPTFSSSTRNLILVPTITSRPLGMEFSGTLYILNGTETVILCSNRVTVDQPSLLWCWAMWLGNSSSVLCVSSHFITLKKKAVPSFELPKNTAKQDKRPASSIRK